jgi:RNA polymerase sporulation-specific sigma factor
MPLSAAARKRLVAKSLSAPTDLDDDRLVELAREGDTDSLDILLQRYTSYARSKAKTYFLIGADREDIVQEGMIGLFKAIRDFDASKTVSFRSFAELCITRQIITAIKGATRHKHAPLNSYVSLHRPVSSEDDGERQLVDFLASSRVIDPVELVVAEDEVHQIRTFLAEILSELEVEVLNLYLEGRSYQEIAAGLKRQAKSIDNALQRIKRKLETFLRQREEAETAEQVLHVAPFASEPVAATTKLAAVGTIDRTDPAPMRTVTRTGGNPGDLRSSLRFAVAAAAQRGAEAASRTRSRGR